MTEFINVNHDFFTQNSGDERNVRKTPTFNDSIYLKDKLGANETERIMKIRLLPVAFDNADLMAVVNIHSLKVDKEISQSGFKTFTCLNESPTDRKCPLCAKGSEYWAKGKIEAENGNEALATSFKDAGKKLFNKKAYIVRCIERGKENEGVKFWRFYENSLGNGIYNKLESAKKAAKIDTGNPDYDIFDIYKGRDLILTLTKGTGNNGQPITNISISVSSNETPLSPDANQMSAWINDTKTWKDVYSTKSYEYLKIIADGGIPYWDKETKKYVAKSEFEANKNQLQADEIKTNDELRQQYLGMNIIPQNVTPSFPDMNNGGLPF